LLEKHGYAGVAGLARISPDPTTWTKKEWDFITEIASVTIKKDASNLNPSTLLKIFGYTLKHSQIVNFLKLLAEETVQAARLVRMFETEDFDVAWRNVS